MMKISKTEVLFYVVKKRGTVRSGSYGTNYQCVHQNVINIKTILKEVCFMIIEIFGILKFTLCLFASFMIIMNHPFISTCRRHL